ncbi:MAG: FFLEELY motif protein [Betaproteobacteria bacterium]
MASPDVRTLLAQSLGRVIALRRQLHAQDKVAQRWLALKDWQSQRLRRTYPDLFAQPRYLIAGEFFLTELYGARDFEQRDVEAMRVVPKLARMLPDKAIETLVAAVELDELSETLDARVAERVRLPITDDIYRVAYRDAGTLAERTQQINMVDRIGKSLEKLAKVPLLAGMIRMMRVPAEAAGVGHLHHFLDSGFNAFKAMGPAGEFLQTIRARETALMQRLLSDDPQPFRDLLPPPAQ